MHHDSEESKSFKVQLMEYWSSKNMSNIKIPQIGGRELDFFKLYKAVIKRGGAQAVSNNKMWKEIVNGFGLPSTCTSASFTLRNHYQRFLLGYEQKYFFNKDDDDVLPQLKKGRNHNRKKDNLDGNHDGDSSESGSESEDSKEPFVKKIKPNPTTLRDGSKLPEDGKQINSQQLPMRPLNLRPSAAPVMRYEHPKQEPQKSELFKQLTEAYQVNNTTAKQELFFTKKNKMFPVVSDMKRILLAFESHIQDEITFALNSLLLYSVNNIQQFTFESHSMLLEGLINYLEESIKNVPSLNKVLNIKEVHAKHTSDPYSHRSSEFTFSNPPQTKEGFKELNIINNYNYPVCDILHFNTIKKRDVSPMFYLRKKQQGTSFSGLREMVGEVQLLEQIRTIFLILRNLSFIKQNEIFMGKNERLVMLMIQLFVLNCDSQITKYILEILANLSKHIQLLHMPDYKAFCERLFDVLNADTSDELEACVDIIRNLIAIQENESIIENFLPKYIDQVTRLMLQAQGDIREGILEFLCFLSDLRMNTRVLLARHPKLIMRMVGLLNSGVMKANRMQPQQHGNHQGLGQANQKQGTDANAERNSEKITKLAALTLSNISLAPASRAYLKPFEKDLFIVTATDETVTKYLSSILSDLMNYDPSNDPERQYMLSTTLI